MKDPVSESESCLQDEDVTTGPFTLTFISGVTLTNQGVSAVDTTNIQFRYYNSPNQFSYNTSYIEHTWCKGNVTLIPAS